MSLPHPSPDVVYRAVADGAVLLSTKRELYFGLNAVGACVWERLPPVFTDLDELCADIGRLHPEVHPTTIRADVQQLLGDLLEHGLVAARELALGAA